MLMVVFPSYNTIYDHLKKHPSTGNIRYFMEQELLQKAAWDFKDVTAPLGLVTAHITKAMLSYDLPFATRASLTRDLFYAVVDCAYGYNNSIKIPITEKGTLDLANLKILPKQLGT